MWFFKSECDKISERLWDYSAQRLSATETAQIESHLPQCARCQAEAESYRQTLAMLGATRRLPLPASQTTWQDLRPRLAPAVRRSGLRSADLLPRLTLAGAGTALAATLLVVFFSGGHRPTQGNYGTLRPDGAQQAAPNSPERTLTADPTVAHNDTRPRALDSGASGLTLGAFFNNSFARLAAPNSVERSSTKTTPKVSPPRHRNEASIARLNSGGVHTKSAATSEESAAQLDGGNATPRTQKNYVLNPVTPSAADDETAHRYVISSIPAAQSGGTVPSNDGTEEGRAW